MIGWTPATIVRISANGKTARFEVEPPDRALAKGEKAPVYPAIGPWLAYSDGAYAGELVWRATTPPTTVRVKGGALWNGDKLWISTMDSGYQRMAAAGPVALKNRFGGGLVHGLLLEVGPWGTDGLIAMYQTAFVLLDGELATKKQLAIPSLLKGAHGFYRAFSDPSGSNICVSTSDGHVRCTLP